MFLSPVVGTQRGTKKQEGATFGSAATAEEVLPSGDILARVKKASHIGAEVNHWQMREGGDRIKISKAKGTGETVHLSTTKQENVKPMEA